MTEKAYIFHIKAVGNMEVDDWFFTATMTGKFESNEHAVSHILNALHETHLEDSITYPHAHYEVQFFNVGQRVTDDLFIY